MLHKYLRDIFFPRFPELEDLVQGIEEFTKSVQIMQNDNYESKSLEEVIGTKVMIAIATALIRSPLKKLPNPEQIPPVSNDILSLIDNKRKILSFLQTRMASTAPNLYHLLGASVAALIITAAGNLEKLSLMPACNIQVLGLSRNHLPGLSTLNKFTSYLSSTDFVQNAGALHKKAERMLAGKVALVSRIDRFGEFKDGSKGKEYKKMLENSLEKAMEVSTLMGKKPLPVPEEYKKTKRGGERIRAAKKKYQMTDVRKMMNRVQFGVEQQDEFRDTGIGFGMLGKGKTSIKASKNKHKISAKSKALLAEGTTSCFAFVGNTEVKLENPETIRESSSSKYFDSTLGFSTVLSSLKK